MKIDGIVMKNEVIVMGACLIDLCDGYIWFYVENIFVVEFLGCVLELFRVFYE